MSFAGPQAQTKVARTKDDNTKRKSPAKASAAERPRRAAPAPTRSAASVRTAAKARATTAAGKPSKKEPESPKLPPPPAPSVSAAPKPPPYKPAPAPSVVAPTPKAPPPVAAPVSPTVMSPPAAAPVAQFKVGDKAVYPRGGVAEVIGLEELDIGGNRQRFYVLKLLQNNSKIRVPVGNESAVGLRQLISEQEIMEVFDILRERTVAFDKQTWNRRFRGFMDKIKTGSIYDVAEVLRDLYRLKTDKQLSFGEKRMLDEARGLIVKEIAIARGQTEEDVKNEIEAIFLSN